MPGSITLNAGDKVSTPDHGDDLQECYTFSLRECFGTHESVGFFSIFKRASASGKLSNTRLLIPSEIKIRKHFPSKNNSKPITIALAQQESAFEQHAEKAPFGARES